QAASRGRQCPGNVQAFPGLSRFAADGIRATRTLSGAGCDGWAAGFRTIVAALKTQEKTFRRNTMILRRHLLLGATALTAAALASLPAAAEDTVKVGLIVPLTGQQASTGKQIEAAIKLYQAQHGASVAGKKVEVIVKDDGAVPDNTKRIAQELI